MERRSATRARPTPPSTACREPCVACAAGQHAHAVRCARGVCSAVDVGGRMTVGGDRAAAMAVWLLRSSPSLTPTTSLMSLTTLTSLTNLTSLTTMPPTAPYLTAEGGLGGASSVATLLPLAAPVRFLVFLGGAPPNGRVGGCWHAVEHAHVGRGRGQWRGRRRAAAFALRGLASWGHNLAVATAAAAAALMG